MNKRKHVVIALLLSCLTATLFLGATSITTNSASDGPPYLPYDPWLDTDDDGKITALDIKRLKMAYDSSGDPTKNVNITNWPEWLAVGNVTVTNLPLDEEGNLKIAVKVTEKPTFPTILELCPVQFRANVTGDYQIVLVPTSWRAPFYGSTWIGNWTDSSTYVEVIDGRFIHQTYPLTNYDIYGQVYVQLGIRTSRQTQSTVWIRGFVTFEKITNNGTIDTLASWNIPEQADGVYPDEFYWCLICEFEELTTIY